MPLKYKFVPEEMGFVLITYLTAGKMGFRESKKSLFQRIFNGH